MWVYMHLYELMQALSFLEVATEFLNAHMTMTVLEMSQKAWISTQLTLQKS